LGAGITFPAKWLTERHIRLDFRRDMRTNNELLIHHGRNCRIAAADRGIFQRGPGRGTSGNR
jgi:hypothetical protein